MTENHFIEAVGVEWWWQQWSMQKTKWWNNKRKMPKV